MFTLKNEDIINFLYQNIKILNKKDMEVFCVELKNDMNISIIYDGSEESYIIGLYYKNFRRMYMSVNYLLSRLYKCEFKNLYSLNVLHESLLQKNTEYTMHRNVYFNFPSLLEENIDLNNILDVLKEKEENFEKIQLVKHIYLLVQLVYMYLYEVACEINEDDNNLGYKKEDFKEFLLLLLEVQVNL